MSLSSKLQLRKPWKAGPFSKITENFFASEVSSRNRIAVARTFIPCGALQRALRVDKAAIAARQSKWSLGTSTVGAINFENYK
jgi:hypothetical protein